MRSRIARNTASALLTAALAATLVTTAAADEVTFSYQGKLELNGTAVNGPADIRFRLWDNDTGGNPVGAIDTQLAVPVADGLFSLEVNPGGGAFDGSPRWLEIEVRYPAGSGSYEALSPRQHVAATPYALYSLAPWETMVNGQLRYLDGNVGIGSTSPVDGLGYPNSWNGLHIASNQAGDHGLAIVEGDVGARLHLRANASSVGNRNFVFQNDSNVVNMTWLNSNLSNRLHVMQITPNGDIGIGATSPIQRLDVNGSVSVRTGVIQKGGAAVMATNDLGLYSMDPGWIRFVTNGGPFQFFTNSAQGASASPDMSALAMTITADNNVGIGTPSPDPGTRLHALRSSGAGSAIFAQNTAVVPNSTGLEACAAGTTSAAVRAFAGPEDGTCGIYAETASPITVSGIGAAVMGVATATVGTPVGIAGLTSAPNGTAVHGNSLATSGPTITMRAFNASTEGAGISSHCTAGSGLTRAFWGICNSPGGFAGWFEGNSFFSGSVGIGAMNPNFLLNVMGSAAKPGGGSWSTASDKRLKKNVEPLKGTLDRLLDLHGYTFEYIDPEAIHELPGERIGMVAQEIENVFPDWVETTADGYMRVTYRGFEALAVEALRDLRCEKDAQIDSLRGEKELLQKQLSNLAERLEKLERASAAK